MSHVM